MTDLLRGKFILSAPDPGESTIMIRISYNVKTHKTYESSAQFFAIQISSFRFVSSPVQTPFQIDTCYGYAIPRDYCRMRRCTVSEH